MEGRISGGGGCCIARYTHNHGPSQTYYNPFDDLSKINHIMLRFRPIAPKPVATIAPSNSTPTKNDTVLKGKRKNTGNTTTNGGSKRGRKSSSRSPDSSSNGYKVTLPLLPETPSKKNNENNFGQSNKSVPKWICFGSDQTAVEESSVIVEGVTDTWTDGNGVGCSDEEWKVRLDEDTCPGFISDGWNRVLWTNKAYRRMVGGDEDTCRVVMVKLGMKEKVVKLYPAFTCRVKVQYGKQSSMTVPCDAWRLKGDGFAWRLDITAALSLGR